MTEDPTGSHEGLIDSPVILVNDVLASVSYMDKVAASAAGLAGAAQAAFLSFVSIDLSQDEVEGTIQAMARARGLAVAAAMHADEILTMLLEGDEDEGEGEESVEPEPVEQEAKIAP